mgnify:CR=1 FL=1
MSEDRKQFVASNLQPEDSDNTAPVLDERAFQFDELIYQNPSIRRGFTYDSEQARNFDQSNVNKAKEGVMELLKDAMEKAKKQVGDLKSKARREGYDAGFEGGFKKGEQAAREEFEPFLKNTQKLIEDLSGFRKEMYDKVEREMVEMIISLAKKVIHFEFSTREDAVQEMIRLAVQSVLDRETMVIKINPTDKGYAESFRPELHHLFGEIKNITFEAHSGIERGGCVIETNFGVIDARIEKLEEQIDRILNLSPALPENLVAAAQVSEETVEKSNEPQTPEKETDDNDPKPDSPDSQV